MKTRFKDLQIGQIYYSVHDNLKVRPITIIDIGKSSYTYKDYLGNEIYSVKYPDCYQSNDLLDIFLNIADAIEHAQIIFNRQNQM